jgi:hypothetical protein
LRGLGGVVLVPRALLPVRLFELEELEELTEGGVQVKADDELVCGD